MNHGFLVVLWSWLDSHVWRLGACPWFPSSRPILQCAVGTDRRRSPTQQELFRRLPASCLLTAPYRPCPRLSLESVLGDTARERLRVIAMLEVYHSRSLFWTQPVNVLPHHRGASSDAVGLGGGRPPVQHSLIRCIHGPEEQPLSLCVPVAWTKGPILGTLSPHINYPLKWPWVKRTLGGRVGRG